MNVIEDQNFDSLNINDLLNKPMENNNGVLTPSDNIQTEQKPLIEFKGVSKTYTSGHTHALSDVNIRIFPGEFVFVVGASGAGKSTFMKLIMREETPSSGNIFVNDYNLTTMKHKDIAYYRRTMGIVFQDFRLIPTMDVFDNIAFAMHVVGADNATIRREVPKVLNLVGLQHRARALPDQLSGGEQQRVGLARAIINRPKLLIADEPTGNVDPNMSYKIVELIDKINQAGTTVLMVTHDHSLVRDFRHRVIMLDNGKIVADNAEGIANE